MLQITSGAGRLICGLTADLPGGQAQRRGDVAFRRVVEVDRHEAPQLLSPAPFALLRQPQLLRDHGHGRDEHVAVRAARRRAAVSTPTDRRLPSATLLLYKISAIKYEKLERNLRTISSRIAVCAFDYKRQTFYNK